MAVDFIMLSVHIKNDPVTYRNEFIDQLEYFNSLIHLHKPPMVDLKLSLNFIVKNMIRYSTDAEIVEIFKRIDFMNVMRRLKQKEKCRVLNEMILLRKNKIFSSVELFRLFILNGHNSTQLEEYLEEETLESLENIYRQCGAVEENKRGNFRSEKQHEAAMISDKSRRIAYYYILKVVERFNLKSEVIYDPIFNKTTPKLFKYCLYYFTDALDIKLSPDLITKKMGDEIYERILTDKNEEHLEKYVKIYLAYLNHNNVAAKDKKEKILSNRVPMAKIHTVIKKLLNGIEINAQLTFKYIKHAINAKTIELIASEVMNFREDEITATGLNLLREIYKETQDEKLHSTIEDLVDKYQGTKVKCIEYSYKGVMNAIRRVKRDTAANDEEIENIEEENCESMSLLDDENLNEFSEELSEEGDLSEERDFTIKHTTTKEEKETKRLAGQKKAKLLREKKEKKKKAGNKHKKGRSKVQGNARLFRKNKK